MSEFAEHVSQMLADFAPVQIKRMFGGYGVFRDGLMFGLIADDVLYLKADTHSVAAFEALSLEPFTYTRAGKQARLSYFRAPDSCYDDPACAHEWATRAFDAALRARKPAPRRRRGVER